MHHPNAAFLEFHELTRSLGDLSEAHQVMALKRSLLHALERAVQFQDRADMLEGEIDRLKAETSARAREHQAFSAELHRQLTEASRELATTKAEGQEQLRSLRLEVLSMEDQCHALDEICRSLLLTIEQAACSSGDGRKAPQEIRVSA
jgi:hypothetical protein